MNEILVRCHDVAKHFGPARAVDGLDLVLERGRLTALIGPSGCGKTTLLRLLAGFEALDRGWIELAGHRVAEHGRTVPPEQRRIGMVFQDYALFPHLTVAQNVGFGLRDARGREKRVAGWLERVGLGGLAERYPHELSGGQQQRVALARALAPEPELLLLDEPFSNLDAGLRARVRDEVREILEEAGTTVVLVTHDREEALTLADQVAVMGAGRILQVGSPEDLYRCPATPGVAALLGQVNLLRGEALGSVARCDLGEVSLLDPQRGPVLLMLRPEWLSLEPASHEGAPGACRVLRTTYHGAFWLVAVRLAAGTELRVQTQTRPRVRPGDRACVQAVHAAACWSQSAAPRESLAPARRPSGIPLAEGQPARVPR
ncbi:ABC transporter ATP-binding protein [Limnochorda pilosa]|uniref:ABC-type quaternary amine transporter n=1 Tax=Limnochorda pilosa TaxID=1555112 RepID=A0A0K2SPY1_LIMPI|nr:ABC transporter ATP-binding protein [Limnochorda pilosa]BAS29175.1 ABC transporter [Limnochorda pilosa]